MAATLATLALTLPAQAATPAPAFKPDLARGQQLAAACMACHTADGSRGAPANPILQGQHPEYLVKQLTEFKAGKRKNAIMQGFAATLTEEDMKNVAAFYASKQAKPGFAKNKDTIALGEQIYRGGIASKAVPACAGCHTATTALLHMQQNGGVIMQGGAAGLTSVNQIKTATGATAVPAETCGVCHGPGGSADVKVEHRVTSFRFR